jgi:hypothetical protein
MKPKSILLTILILASLGLALYLAVHTNLGGIFRTPTPTASRTNTPTATATPTFTSTPTATQTSAMTFTSTPTATQTSTPTSTNTPLPPTEKSGGNNDNCNPISGCGGNH